MFYEEVTDFQSNNFSGFNFVTRNIPTTISKGVELSLLTRPLDGLTLQIPFGHGAPNPAAIAKERIPVPSGPMIIGGPKRALG